MVVAAARRFGVAAGRADVIMAMAGVTVAGMIVAGMIVRRVAVIRMIGPLAGVRVARLSAAGAAGAGGRVFMLFDWR